MTDDASPLRWITIDYFGVSASGKTAIWTVRSTGDSRHRLGEVRWFASWRKYAFYPEMGCVFEEDCLRDIAAFCETATEAHRLKVPARGAP